MWGEASDQNRAQMPHLALLGHYGQAGKNPPSYFPNSFSRNCLKRGLSSAPSVDFGGRSGQTRPDGAAPVPCEATFRDLLGLFRQFQHEVCRTPHGQSSGTVKLHSWISALGQQGTEAETGWLGVLRLTYPLARRPSPSGTTPDRALYRSVFRDTLVA